MESMELAWWVWMAGGLALVLGEMLTPGGFYLIFFGAAALGVGALKLGGWNPGFALEGLVFTLASIMACLFFRQPLLERFQRLTPETKVDSMVGGAATALEEIAANGHGKAEFRGTAWSAQNVGEHPIPKSGRCRVERVEDLTLFIRLE